MRCLLRITANLALYSLLAVACSDDDPTTANPQIATVGVLESNALVGLHGTMTLTPVARDANNKAIDGQVFTWSSSDVTTATVDNSGVVSGLRLGGPVTITVASGGRTGSAQVLVTPAGVVVTPAIDSLLAGQSTQFTA